MPKIVCKGLRVRPRDPPAEPRIPIWCGWPRNLTDLTRRAGAPVIVPCGAHCVGLVRLGNGRSDSAATTPSCAIPRNASPYSRTAHFRFIHNVIGAGEKYVCIASAWPSPRRAGRHYRATISSSQRQRQPRGLPSCPPQSRASRPVDLPRFESKVVLLKLDDSRRPEEPHWCGSMVKNRKVLSRLGLGGFRGAVLAVCVYG